jgi:hypothetical protein
MEDRDVEDADAVGESMGDAVTELATEEAMESVVMVRLKAGFCGRAVVEAIVVNWKSN